jgi:hypothetical protein
MKSSDIVQQLALLLPALSDKFTGNFSVVSLIRVGTTVTVTTTTAHGLAVGQQVNITGAQTPLAISSLTRSGVTGTLVTTNNHDMSEGFSTTVEISGATEAEFNGTFVLKTVPNRKTITFTMVDSGPTTATGSPILLNGSSALQSYNGLQNVTVVPDTTSFEYEITDATLFTPAGGIITARTNPRISAHIDSELLLSAYTAKPQSELWAFVVLGDVTASKSRNINSDAVDNLQQSNQYRQQLIHPFNVFVFFPTSDEIGGRESRDLAEDIFRPLCRSLLSSKLDSGLSVGAQNPINFSDHGFFAYNKAFYVHSYNFFAVADLTFNDTIEYGLDVAFRDIAITIGVNTGTEVMTASIDLDDIILP